MTKYSVFFFLIFFASNITAQPLPLDKVVRKGKLPNGFTYYIRHNTEPAKRVVLYLVNNVGSILENDDQRGLAHFMEHMSFNGTTHYPKNDLIHYLEKSGVRFGADLNAYTGFDETVYQLPLPTDDPQLLKNGFQIMRDWAANATLVDSEINAERGVVLEEKRTHKGAAQRIQELTFPVMTNYSRYADRLPIGTDTVLNNFKRSTIVNFYKDWYRPDLQALIVVGDVNVDSVEMRIKSLFSDLKNPANERPRTKYTIPLVGKNHFISVTDKEYPYTVIQVVTKEKSHELITLQDYQATINQNLYNQMLAARITELAQKPNPPFIQAEADMEDFLGGVNIFGVVAVAKPGMLEQSFKSVWELIRQLKLYGFTEQEFERAKTDYLSSLASSVREKDKRNSESFAKEYVNLFIKHEASPGIEEEYKITDEYLKNAKLADINKLSASYITDTNQDVIIMAPQKDSASLPSQVVVENWMKAVNNMAIVPYADKFTNQALLSKSIIPGKVIGETKDKEIVTTSLTLSNGVKVVLKPTDFKNDEIRFTAFSPGGTSLYSDADFESANTAAYLVDNSGISHFSPTDLPKVLTGKQLSVSPFINERTEGIGGTSAPKDFETTLQLIHLYFTEPRKDSVVFKNMIDQSITSIANRNSDPSSVFADTVAAVLGNYSIRRTGPTVEKLKQIDMDRAFDIYRERFGNAGSFTFFFVGNFNVDSIKPLLEKYLGSLPSTSDKEEARDLHIHIPSGKITAIAYKGKDAKAVVRLVISGDYTYSPENNIQLTALGDILQFRITDRLREKEGGTYSPGVRTTFNKYPSSRYAFTIVFSCAPDNVDKLIDAAKEEIENLKANGATDVDVTKFSSEEARQYELQLKDNKAWLGYLNRQYENGDSPNTILNYPNLIKQVTPASVKLAANQYLNESNFIKLLLLPEKTN